MIGRLRGYVVERKPPALLMEVGGVGYEVEAPMSTFYTLPAAEVEVTLFTHLAIREDAHVLYGFACEADRALFRALLKVTGVGGKMALGVLSGMSAGEFAQAVERGDMAALTRLPGVGRKTAERLVVEMRDKISALSTGVPLRNAAMPVVPAGVDQDALSALIALGYKAAEAAAMVDRVASPEMDTEAVIRAALKTVVK